MTPAHLENPTTHFAIHPSDKIARRYASMIQSSWHPKRTAAFLLGRHAADLLLCSENIKDFTVLNDSDGVPIFPDSIVASISHTTSLAVASGVKTDGSILSLGVDIERISRAKKEILRTIATDREKSWYDPLPAISTLRLFSLKEAIFKAVFPLFRTPLVFQDAEIKPLENDKFSLELLHKTPLSIEKISLISLKMPSPREADLDEVILSHCIVSQ